VKLDGVGKEWGLLSPEDNAASGWTTCALVS
jgi:hypothetical protein